MKINVPDLVLKLQNLQDEDWVRFLNVRFVETDAHGNKRYLTLEHVDAEPVLTRDGEDVFIWLKEEPKEK